VDKVFAVFIVLLAAIYLLRKFYLVFKGKDTGCGCESCDLKTKADPCSCQAKEVLKDTDQSS